MANVIDTCTAAIAAVTPTATFKEIHADDRERVDVLPAVTMAWMGATRTDDYGVRREWHQHSWQHTFVVRLRFRFEPANRTVTDAAIHDGVKAFINAFEADSTLGNRVTASGILSVDEPALLANAHKAIVGIAVDVHVAIKAAGAW